MFICRGTSGEASARFATEVKSAQDDQVTLLLAHEFPSFVGNDADRHACAFNDFWKADCTPESLLQRNVYKDIAICEEKNFGLAVRPFGIPATIPKLP